MAREDTGNTDSTECKHIQVLPKVLQIAVIPDLQRPASEADFFTTSANDVCCNEITWLVGKPGFVYWYGSNGISVWRSKVGHIAKRVVLATLRPPILYLSAHLVFADCPREQRL